MLKHWSLIDFGSFSFGCPRFKISVRDFNLAEILGFLFRKLVAFKLYDKTKTLTLTKKAASYVEDLVLGLHFHLHLLPVSHPLSDL